MQKSSFKNNFKTFYPFLIFCFSFLLYAQTLNFKFTMFDDDSLLMANKEFFTKDGSISKIFTTDAFMQNNKTFYRPLQNLSFLIDVKIAGKLNAGMFHFSNVLLFSLIAFSLYFLLLKFNISYLHAFLGTLFYSAHPLFASSAAWIPARGDLLLTLFSILAFIFWINFLHHKKYSALIITWLCFTLALFSKETAALLPVLFLIYLLIFEHKPKIDVKMVLLGFLGLCTALAWYYLRNLSIINSDLDLTTSDFLQNLLAIPASLAMFVAPYHFSTVPEFTPVKLILGFALLCLMVVLIVKKSALPRGEKIFYLLWFLLLLLPTFFAKAKEWDYLDHRFLLPLITVLIFLLLHIQKISKTKVITVSVILISVFSIVTFLNAQAFSTPITFYEAAKDNKNKPEVYYFLKGNIEQITEKYDKALQSYNAAIFYQPEHYRALNNRGIIKQTKGDFEGALADYNRAIDLGLKNYHIFKNRGTVKIHLEDAAGAIEDFESALEFEPHADTYTTLGIICGQNGEVEKSIDYLTKAIETDPTYTLAYYNRSFAKYISSDYTGALADCNTLFAIDSLYPNVRILKEQIKKNLKP